MPTPNFMAALEGDQALLLQSFGANKELEYASESVAFILGYSFDEWKKLDGTEVLACQHEDAIYYRRHKDGSSVKMKNIYWNANTHNQQLLTIDKVEIDDQELRTIFAEFVVDENCLIQRCKIGEAASLVQGASSFLEDCVGQQLASVFRTSKTPIESAINTTLTKHNVYNVDAMLYPGLVPVSDNGSGMKAPESVDDEDKSRQLQTQQLYPLFVTMDVYIRLDGMAVAVLHHVRSLLSEEGERTVASSSFNPYSTVHRILSLEEELLYLHDFRDNAVLPMYSMNVNGNITWANKAMIAMMGYENEWHQYIGSNSLSYHVDQDLVQQMAKTVFAGGTLKDFKCQLKHKSGHVIDVIYNTSCRFSATGTFLNSRCIVQDITDKLRLQKQHEHSNQLRIEAELKAQEAISLSHLKSSFISTMSHEIRTPIHGVIGATSLLAYTHLSEEQEEYLHTISASADCLLSLVNNILDISKIESGHLEIVNVPMRLSDQLYKVLRVVQQRATDKELDFMCTFDDELQQLRSKEEDWFYSDPMRLVQILLNFLSNAIKFTSEGKVECRFSVLDRATIETTKVEIAKRNTVQTRASPSAAAAPSAAAEEEDTNTDSEIEQYWLLIEVEDTGIGIADCSNLFSDFQQGNASISQNYGGTGLGLSISKKLAELMGGIVGMYSQVGKGTTVWMKAPMRKVRRPAQTAVVGCETPSTPNKIKVGSHSSETNSDKSSNANFSEMQNITTNSSSSASDKATSSAAMIHSASTRNASVAPEKLTQRIHFPSRLPQQPKPRAEAAPAAAAAAALKVTSKNMQLEAGNTRLLIAEDNLMNQKLLQRMLQTLGYQDIKIASDGQIALDMTIAAYNAGRPFHITFMDCMMPNMNGWTATEKIREFENNCGHDRSVILALTANASADDAVRATEAGMDEYASKPITRDQLNVLTLKWLGRLPHDDTGR